MSGMDDPLLFPCTVCSAAIEQPCRDKTAPGWPPTPPHQNRIRLAGG